MNLGGVLDIDELSDKFENQPCQPISDGAIAHLRQMPMWAYVVTKRPSGKRRASCVAIVRHPSSVVSRKLFSL